ncbi:MAG TPA: NAD(P)H-dependent glycerol-3-phosphate dehydrogenase [Elusimicrobiales bacterium]|nr:NAD(P)H-dependent glycerol-3-phosphate dehydrogenase [Elusimicrobiales bacterium]
MTKKITVLGAGLWGSVLANHIANKGNKVTLWEYDRDLFDKIKKTGKHPSLEKFKFNKTIILTDSLYKSLADADAIIVAINSKGIRRLIRKISKYIKPQTPIITASKGLEYKTYFTMSEVIESELKNKNPVFAISGPSFAKEVAVMVPTKLVLAGKTPALLNKLKNYFNGYPLAIETTTDRKAVELGAALKNVFAIACGIIDEKFGENTKAAFITQAMDEMNNIIKSFGGKSKTVYGFSGLGDFILTGGSVKSRNTLLGHKLAKGTNLTKAKEQIKTVTEGINSVKVLNAIVVRKKINAPIVKSIYNIVYKGKSLENLLKPMGFKDAKK